MSQLAKMKVIHENEGDLNEPKYQIGDRIPGTEIVVCGLMITSTGMYKYFLQISPDNSLVVDDENIEATIFLLTKNQPTAKMEIVFLWL